MHCNGGMQPLEGRKSTTRNECHELFDLHKADEQLDMGVSDV